MTITMTVGGVDCDAKVLDNEITCRIPKNLTVPSEGLPVKVRFCFSDYSLCHVIQPLESTFKQ